MVCLRPFRPQSPGTRLRALVDWTTVITAGIASTVPTVPAVLAVIWGRRNHRAMQTPSGDSIGMVVERTHDLAAVATLKDIRDVEVTAQSGNVIRRVNDNPESPLRVNGEKK